MAELVEINKIRPLASVAYSYGNDGRDGCYYIRFQCPTCKRTIGRGYKSETACDKCGTFYDWGKSSPVIKLVRTIEWK